MRLPIPNSLISVDDRDCWCSCGQFYMPPASFMTHLEALLRRLGAKDFDWGEDRGVFTWLHMW